MVFGDMIFQPDTISIIGFPSMKNKQHENRRMPHNQLSTWKAALKIQLVSHRMRHQFLRSHSRKYDIVTKHCVNKTRKNAKENLWLKALCYKTWENLRETFEFINKSLVKLVSWSSQLISQETIEIPILQTDTAAPNAKSINSQVKILRAKSKCIKLQLN